MGTSDRIDEFIGRLDDAHTFAATTRSGFHQHRISDRCRRGKHVEFIGHLDRRERGYASLDHQRFGCELVTHGCNRMRGRTNPRHASVYDCRSEVCVLSQEAVARVHCVGTGGLSSGKDLGDVEIRLCWRASPKGDRLMCFAHKWSVGIAVGENRDGLDTHVMGTTEDSSSDFTPVSDQESPYRMLRHYWFIGRHRIPLLP